MRWKKKILGAAILLSWELQKFADSDWDQSDGLGDCLITTWIPILTK